MSDTLIDTTPGRIIFNDILDPGMPFYNFELDKKRAVQHHLRLPPDPGTAGRDARAPGQPQDDRLQVGHRAGMSFGKDDMLVPPTKEKIIGETQKEVEQIQKANTPAASSPRVSAT